MPDEIIQILDDLSRRFGIVIDWGSENVLPYLQDLMGRYVQYDITINSVKFALYCIALSITVIISIRLIKILSKDEDYDYEVFGFFLSLVAVPLVCSILLIIGIYDCTKMIIQGLTIPEKTIYEFLMSNMKG